MDGFKADPIAGSTATLEGKCRGLELEESAVGPSLPLFRVPVLRVSRLLVILDEGRDCWIVFSPCWDAELFELEASTR